MNKTIDTVPKALPRDWRPLLRAALDAGCEVVRRKNGIIIREVEGTGTVNMHFSPGVHNRALENTRSELKRIGVDV